MGLFDKAKDALKKTTSSGVLSQDGNGGFSLDFGAPKRAEQEAAAKAAREAEEAAKKAEEARKAEEAKRLCEAEGHLPTEKFAVPGWKDGVFIAIDKNGCLLGKCPRCGAMIPGEKVSDFSSDGFAEELTCDAIWDCDGEWIKVGKYTVKLKKEESYYMIADKNGVSSIRRGDPFLYVYAESDSFEPNEEFPFGAELSKRFVLNDAEGQLTGASEPIVLYDEAYCNSLSLDDQLAYLNRMKNESVTRYLIPAFKGYNKLSVYAEVGKK